MKADERDILGSFKVTPFPLYRNATIDFATLGKKNQVPMLIEVDVTAAQQALQRRKEITVEGLSFTGWVIKCVAQAAGEHKRIHAMRRGRKGLVLFDDVDVNMPVERRVAGSHDSDTLPMPLVIRRANEKSVEQIHAEIRAAQSLPLAPGEQIISMDGPSVRPWVMRLFLALPFAIRKALVWNHLTRDPFFTKSVMGTVSVTAVGMFGRMGGGGSWAVPVEITPFFMAIGGIARRPAFAGDRIERREFLSLTLAFDHDVIDGAPVARFVARLTDLMEGAFGLSPGYIADRELVPTSFPS